MSRYSLSHLADQALLRDLASLVSNDRNTTASLLAHLAEVEARRLYRPAAYSSMYAYCVGELRLSEAAAYKRIEVARLARKHPILFSAIADGRLNLSSVMMLAPHLCSGSVEELVTAATHKTRRELELLLAARFPKPDVPTQLQPIGLAHSIAPSTDDANALQLAPGRVDTHIHDISELAPSRVEDFSAEVAPAQVEQALPPTPRPKLAPLSAERYALQVTLGKETYDKLRHAQALLGHSVPSGDIAQVLDRALDELVRKLEKRRFAAPTRTPPRHGSKRPTGSRYVPASIRSAVWQRDGGQCTFVSERGKRCDANSCLEFDHVEPVGRGGTASIAGMRLRCRAHNQLEAEHVYGEAFMRGKREQARERVEGRAKAKAAAEAQTRARDHDVIPWLRQLGFRADEARRAAERCDAMPEASLEGRVRLALRHLAPNCRHVSAHLTSSPA